MFVHSILKSVEKLRKLLHTTETAICYPLTMLSKVFSSKMIENTLCTKNLEAEMLHVLSAVFFIID